MKLMKLASNLIFQNSNVKFQCKHLLNQRNDRDCKIRIRCYVTLIAPCFSNTFGKHPLDERNNQV